MPPQASSPHGLVPAPAVVQAPAGMGAGFWIPPRTADCSGERPGWFPFQVNVCDVDLEDLGFAYAEWTDRHYRLPPPIPPPAYEHYPTPWS